MKRVLLYQLDGKIPNLALMRIAAHHRALGDDVELRRAGNRGAVQRRLGDAEPDLVYGSLVFVRTRELAEALLGEYPQAHLGGTGWSLTGKLADVGITTTDTDYDVYPSFRQSLGFTQRGCRLKCPFCVVPTKEGSVREESTVHAIWRGDPWPREVLLLDNDFFGQPRWRDRIGELQSGGFKVSFNQGVNARFLTDETAAALASVDYRDDSMKVRRLYTAWDNRKDERRLFAGLELLVKHGVKPDHIMVYMLIGYWKGETHAERDYRRSQLRAFGARPYPMPFERTRDLVDFQRWVIGAYDKRVPWADWARAGGRPEGLNVDAAQQQLRLA